MILEKPGFTVTSVMVGEMIARLRGLPDWEIGRNQEEILLPADELKGALPALREIAFELPDTSTCSLEDDESIDALRVLALRNLAAGGQTEDAHAVIDLLFELDFLDPDFADAVRADFDWLMVQFGEVAVDALCGLLEDLGMEEEVRISAASALNRMAESGVQADRIWELFRKMVRTGALHRAVNGLMLADLAKNPGAATPEFVLEIYDAKVVDVTYSGDRESLEIDLGLREERTTPKPNLSELEEQCQADYFKEKLGPLPDDAAPSAVVEYYLLVYRRPFAASDLAMVHALLSGLIVSPEMPPPSAIMNIVWHTRKVDGSNIPIWDGMEELQRFSDALMAFYNEIVSSLDDRTYEAMATELPEEDGETVYSLESWSEGLTSVAEYLGSLQGVNDFTDDLQRVADELMGALLMESALDEDQVTLLSSEAVSLMFGYRAEQQERGSDEDLSFFSSFSDDSPISIPVTREQPKVGRNDPCPCGSGKKYKRCCAN